MRIAGASTTSAPRSRSRAASALAWARARVTAIVRPASGRAATSASSSCSAATGPDDGDRRRPHAGLGRRRGDLRAAARARCAGRAASRARRPPRARRRSRPAGDEPLGDPRQRAHAHVEDERPREGGERRPVDRRVGLGRVLVAGDERHGAGHAALGHRDPGARGRRHPGGHPGHDLERDPGRAARLRLLAAAPEDERVAALQAHHVAPGERVLDEQPRRLVLRHLLAAADLADVDDLGAVARAGQRLGAGSGGRGGSRRRARSARRRGR